MPNPLPFSLENNEEEDSWNPFPPSPAATAQILQGMHVDIELAKTKLKAKSWTPSYINEDGGFVPGGTNQPQPKVEEDNHLPVDIRRTKISQIMIQKYSPITTKDISGSYTHAIASIPKTVKLPK